MKQKELSLHFGFDEVNQMTFSCVEKIKREKEMAPSPWMAIGMLVLVKTLDTTDPTIIRNILTCFFTTHALVALVLIVLRFKITAANDQTPIDVTDPVPPFGDAKEAKKRRITVVEYDLEQWNEIALKKIGLVVTIMTLVWYQWGHVLPLLFQCIHNPLQVYQSPLTKVVLLGAEAKFDLARPWPPPEVMPGWMKGLMGGGGGHADDGRKKKK